MYYEENVCNDSKVNLKVEKLIILVIPNHYTISEDVGYRIISIIMDQNESCYVKRKYIRIGINVCRIDVYPTLSSRNRTMSEFVLIDGKLIINWIIFAT